MSNLDARYFFNIRNWPTHLNNVIQIKSTETHQMKLWTVIGDKNLKSYGAYKLIWPNVADGPINSNSYEMCTVMFKPPLCDLGTWKG